MKNTFRAFRNRNYALFFCGQSISQIGTWMQRTAISWVIYSLTDSKAMLGLSVFAQQFPSFLLSLFGGVVADRHSRYRIVLITQTASMIQALILAALVLTNHYNAWSILALGVMLGIINAFDVPARQPMILEMITNKEDIPNAVALNSTMVNIARILGPGLSGLVLHNLGAGVCFSLNAVSFVAVIGSLLLMKMPAFTPSATRKQIFTELREGFKYIREVRIISMVLLLVLCLSFLVIPYDTLEAVFARDIFKGNAETMGAIGSFAGIGSILGSLFLASARKIDLRILLLSAIAVLGVGLMVFSRMTDLHVALGVALLMGFGTLMPMTVSITIVQMEAAQNMRSRVMSYMALCLFGMLPLGSLMVGTISEHVGARATMFGQGVMALVIAGVFWRLMVGRKKQEAPAS